LAVGHKIHFIMSYLKPIDPSGVFVGTATPKNEIADLAVDAISEIADFEDVKGARATFYVEESGTKSGFAVVDISKGTAKTEVISAGANLTGVNAAKDNASTLNIYIDAVSNVLSIQNKLAASVDKISFKIDVYAVA